MPLLPDSVLNELDISVDESQVNTSFIPTDPHALRAEDGLSTECSVVFFVIFNACNDRVLLNE